MPDPYKEIADLEAEIDALARAAQSCRKVAVLSKAAIGAGGVLLTLFVIGVTRVDPVALVLAIAAVLGGIALFGSNQSTSDEIAARIKAQEARRASIIDALAFRNAGSDGEAKTPASDR